MRLLRRSRDELKVRGNSCDNKLEFYGRGLADARAIYSLRSVFDATLALRPSPPPPPCTPSPQTQSVPPPPAVPPTDRRRAHRSSLTSTGTSLSAPLARRSSPRIAQDAHRLDAGRAQGVARLCAGLRARRGGDTPQGARPPAVRHPARVLPHQGRGQAPGTPPPPPPPARAHTHAAKTESVRFEELVIQGGPIVLPGALALLHRVRTPTHSSARPPSLTPQADWRRQLRVRLGLDDRDLRCASCVSCYLGARVC